MQSHGRAAYRAHVRSVAMVKVVVIIWRVDHGVSHDAVGQASAAGSNTAVGHSPFLRQLHRAASQFLHLAAMPDARLLLPPITGLSLRTSSDFDVLDRGHGDQARGAVSQWTRCAVAAGRRTRRRWSREQLEKMDIDFDSVVVDAPVGRSPPEITR